MKILLMKPLTQTSTLAIIIASLMLASPLPANAAPSVRLEALSEKTHIHGISVDAVDSSRIYLATHNGFYLVDPAGNATRLSANGDDYMGFTPHPTDASLFYASGHLARGGNTGLIRSNDGGITWKQLAKGDNGPVDFHQMDVSRVNPNLIYGVFGGIQLSEDGGNSWTTVAQSPQGLFDLSASSSNADYLYAATRGGLLVSKNRAQTWTPAHFNRSPASMVQSAGDGSVYAFIGGMGLVRSAGDSMRWAALNNDFGERYLMHLAIDPTNPDRMYAITNTKELLTSSDGGKTWSKF